MSRIDDAVRRILTKKFELGLFEHPYTNRKNLDQVGSTQHRAVARRAVSESQVLLKNRGRVLPLPRHGDVYVAGSNADNIGNQAGGWTLTWQGGSTNQIPGATILQGIRNQARGNVTYSTDASAPIEPDATGVVVVGETPYSEGFGDLGGPQWGFDPGDHGVLRPAQTMQLNAADKAAVDKVCSQAAKCVVIVVSGRPMILDPAQLDEIDGLVEAWLPGSEGDWRVRPALRPAPVHREAARHLAEDARPGADQRRRRELRPALPLRVRAADAVAQRARRRATGSAAPAPPIPA